MKQIFEQYGAGIIATIACLCVMVIVSGVMQGDFGVAGLIDTWMKGGVL